MSQFKGDFNYRVYHDDPCMDSPESTEDEASPVEPSRKRRVWLDGHFEVLQELYRAFKQSGESVFGRSFFQFGAFGQFVNFVYENTVLADADLLKAKMSGAHVSALGLSAGSKHWLHVIQAAKHNGPDGVGPEGVRGWSRTVGTTATGRGQS